MPCCRFKPSTKSQINRCSLRIGTVSTPLILPTQLPLSKAWATVHHLMVLLGIFFMRFGANSEIFLPSIYLTRTGWIHHYQQLIPCPRWIKLGHCTTLEWANLPMVAKHQFSPTKATVCEETSPGPQGYEYQESKTPIFGVADSLVPKRKTIATICLLLCSP